MPPLLVVPAPAGNRALQQLLIRLMMGSCVCMRRTGCLRQLRCTQQRAVSLHRPVAVHQQAPPVCAAHRQVVLPRLAPEVAEEAVTRRRLLRMHVTGGVVAGL